MNEILFKTFIKNHADVKSPQVRDAYGKLAGIGTHEELYNSSPDYRKMVDLQKLEEEGGAHNA